MYNRTEWKDHVTTPSNCYNIVDNGDGTYAITPTGTVMQQGTAQDQVHFNNMETGIFDSHLAFNLLLNAVRQMQRTIEEINAVNSTNSQEVE